MCLIRIYPDCGKGKILHVLTDNTAAESAATKGVIRDENAMRVVRALFAETRARGMRVRAQHIAGVKNPLADAISRLEEPGQRERLVGLIQSAWDSGELKGPVRPRLRWLSGLFLPRRCKGCTGVRGAKGLGASRTQTGV